MDIKSIRIFILLTPYSLLALAQTPSGTEPDSRLFNRSDVRITQSLDSLKIKRRVFSTSIYQEDAKLNSKSVTILFKEDTIARRRYFWGRHIMPLSPIVSFAGVALCYIALKGKPVSTEIMYNNRIVTANYIVRSRPKLFAGLGLFVGSLVLIEYSSELITGSVKRYNHTLGKQQSASRRPALHYGITPSGNLGLYARF